MSQRISVVIPVYNDEDMLREALAALAVQTRSPDELVVVDNGCTDGSMALARAAGARIVVEPERGIPQATAAGFDAAEGEILGRLDADSLAPPDWVERVVAAFDAEPDLDALSGPGRFYGGTPLQTWYGGRIHMPLYYHFVAWLLAHDVLYGSNMALSARAWQDLRGRVHRHRADVHDDLDITLNLQPWMNVRFDPTLVVGVSARPFGSRERRRAAFVGAGHTAAANFAEQSLLSRRRAWRRAQRARPTG